MLFCLCSVRIEGLVEGYVWGRAGSLFHMLKFKKSKS